MSLKVYNTVTREKEEFKPLDPEGKKVGIYVCGVTVYDDCHIGHARVYVAFDTIRRYFMYKGYDDKYIQNFTDVDDKIIARSNERGISTTELTEHYIKEYFNDMHALNVMDADEYPKATEHIQEMIDLVQNLVDKGYAYASGGNVYFSILKAKDKFGTLCHQDLFDMLDGARVDHDDFKDYPKDFALWKRKKEGEVAWDSPWGEGRPGWHVECSAMSMKYLGVTFDIHGGGMDLIFPHHESEILQSECANDAKFVNFWLHNGFVTVDEEKMSKSLNNFSTVKQILENYDPMVMRFFLVYTHYRSPIDFSTSHLDEAKQSYGRLKTMVTNLDHKIVNMDGSGDGSNMELAERVAQVTTKFEEAMDDDFNTRIAIAELFELTRELNKYIGDDGFTDRKSLMDAKEQFLKLSDVMGLKFDDAGLGDEEDAALSADLIQLLIDIREDARANKDWATSDKIRDKLKEMGIVLEDGGDGTRWSKV